MSENIHQKTNTKDLNKSSQPFVAGIEPAVDAMPNPYRLLQNTSDLSSDDILSLQRTIGNQAVLQAVQPSITPPTNKALPSLKMRSDVDEQGASPFAVQDIIERRPSDTIQRKGGSSKSSSKKIFILPRTPYLKRKGFLGRLFSDDYSKEKTGDHLVEIQDAKLSSADITYYKAKLNGDEIKVKFEHTVDDPTQEQVIGINAENNEVANPDILAKHQGSARYILANSPFELWKADPTKEGGGEWLAAAIQNRNREMKNATENGEHYEGMIGSTKVRALKASTADLKSGWEKIAATTPLFDKTKSPPEPNIGDVIQGALGDCYLLASLSSLAQQQPNAIEEMMVDKGERVAVRLYQVDQSDPANHKFKPIYLSVEKSVAMTATGGKLYNRGGLWVSILEKAYAAGGFTGSGNKEKTDPAQMANIDGGQSRFAFEVLTGKKASFQLLQSGPAMGDDNKFSLTGVDKWQGRSSWQPKTAVSVPWDANVINEIKQIKASRQPDDFSKLSIFKSVFSKKEQVNAWYDYLKNPPNPIEKMFTKQNDLAKASKDNQVTIQDFEQVFKKTNLESSVSTAVIKYIKDKKLYPGELSATTGDYSQAQLDSFGGIKTALGQSKAVTISTYSKPSKASQGSGHSGGEHKVDGIAFGHQYSVLDAKENSDITGTGTGNLKVLKVRNPWGTYGREYDFSKTLPSEAGQAVEKGDGVFWIDLKDLTRYFNGVHFSG